MPIIAKSTGNANFESTPLGNQQAVCAFVEDIGTQEGSYMGAPITRREVVVCWELNEFMKKGEYEGRPFMVSKRYTLSLNEKANLRKDLESWRGKAFTEEELAGFDVEKLIGVNCLLNIISYKKKDGTEGTKIGSISKMISGMNNIEIQNKKPPEWIQREREKSTEHEEEMKQYDQTVTPEGEDDLPFR